VECDAPGEARILSAVIPIWAFVAVTVPLVLTPGASTAIVLRNSIVGGTRAGVATAIGANAGSVCYGLLSAFGIALALQRWPGAWVALRAAGVVYLAYLGVQSIRSALQPHAARAPLLDPPRGATGRPVDRILRHIREGFVTNALNPCIDI
jgi:threonine/homoserine/homoserine lactone efflux protein